MNSLITIVKENRADIKENQMSRNCTYHPVLERLVRALTIMFIVLMGMATFNLAGCEPASGTLPDEDGVVNDGDYAKSEFDPYDIAERFYNGDEEAIGEVKNEDELMEVVEILKDMEFEDNPVLYWTTGLGNCRGFWPGATQITTTWANYIPYGNGYQFYWSPNCYMNDSEVAENVCGEDGDNIVSFWMGPDYGDGTGYEVDGTTWSLRSWLLWHQLHHGSGANNNRVYVLGPHGNAYVCLSPVFNPQNLRFAR